MTMTEQTLTRPMTEAEKQLVEQYHNLIYRALRDCGASIDDPAYDAYGECALALILAAQRYMESPYLQRYRFTTIAYRRMRTTLQNGCRAAKARRHPLSLDQMDEGGRSLYDLIPAETECAA